MIIDEPVRGSVPPPWFWALSGIERMRAVAQGLLPLAPLLRLQGIRPAHVGPGSGTYTMPASAWLQGPAAFALEAMVEAALHRSVPADGRMLRAEASSVNRPERDPLRVDTHVYDADGALVTSQHSIGVMIPTSARQKRPAVEAKRILATLLFTDIVGSTEHAGELGDARWRALLDQHRAIIRREMAEREGVEVDTAGDGFLARFDSPARALECARAVRDDVKRLGIEIRAGIHTGECELQGGRLSGIAVHIAARVQTAASSGQIFVSATVKDLVIGMGPRARSNQKVANRRHRETTRKATAFQPSRACRVP